MGKGDTSINYPAQPSYGEALSESLKAQTDLLRGTGEFADTGGLQSLVEQFEAPLRQSTAQIDTDVLRQTLLGSQQKVVRDEATGKYGIPGGQVVTGEDGEPQTAGGGRYQVIQLDKGRMGNPSSYKSVDQQGVKPTYAILDTETGGFTKTIGGEEYDAGDIHEDYGIDAKYGDTTSASRLMQALRNEILEEISEEFSTLRGVIAEGGVDAPTREFNFTNPNIPADPSKAGQEGFDSEGRALLQEGDVVRAEDGMIDLLGDKRQVQGQVPDYVAYVRGREDLTQQYGDAVRSGDTRSMEEFGRDHYETFGKKQGAPLPTKFADTGRQPGFDAQGNFLGLSALAEDIQRGNLSRQREADLADVERLSGRFQDVMEDFRPGTAEAVTAARSVLESQRQNLTGQRPATAEDVEAGRATEVGEMISTGKGLITVPTTDTFGGAATPATLTAATLGVRPTLDADTSFDAFDPITRQTLTADTSFDPSASVTGEGFTATADLQGGQIAADPLREALMTQAQEGLAEGLTDREARQIAEAARARATMMGRTFDQSEAIREAEARVLEDRNRLAQNRAFAQQVLGQEAGLQESDLSRSLQAAAQNQAALNRAAEFTAGQDMQAQLANQAAINQARQFAAQAGISQEEAQARLGQQAELADLGAEQQRRQIALQAGMQQDAQQAEIDQQRDILQAQLNQQGAAFDAEAAQQAALADQRQRQQASQFGVGAQMDAERLNAQLAQQGALGFVDAATRLAALEDQTTLDPFAAILNRAGGGSLGQAGQVFGQANYGLSSGPQYLNPESGLGFISQMAANEASMYGAQQAANASRSSGLLGGLGALGGGLFQGAGAAQGFGKLFCWVAREVYGPMNPQWLMFREWMLSESPNWFYNMYAKYGERFANWISDKPRIKAIIRKWMDSKIGDK